MKEQTFTTDQIISDLAEISPESTYQFEFNRRQFLQTFGAGIAVAFVVGNTGKFNLFAQTRRSMPKDISAWLHIDENGTVNVYTGKVEVGQNIRTSLAQIVAEELRIPIAAIQMIMGDTDLVPYDRGTFGSLTTPVMGTQLRKIAAATRVLLQEMAAKEWNVPASAVDLTNGKALHKPTKQSLNFGQLTRGQKLVKTITDDEPVTPATKWKIAGTSVYKVNARTFVTGQHKYTSDLRLPGMYYAKVLRPPSFGATVEAVELSKARAMPGVIVVHDGNFIGVAAPTESQAQKAIDVIHANWKTEPQPAKSDIFEYLKTHPQESRRRRGPNIVGSVKDAMALAEHTLHQTYTVDYIAHAPLEPRAALAKWENGKLTVWTGTQRPFGVRSELMRAFRLPEDKVRVIMPDTGSGYGGKHSGEAAIEAARLAKAAAKPVRLVWTREEEFTWAYFRPAGIIDISSGAKKNGTIVAWEAHNYNSGNSGLAPTYEIPNQHTEYHAAASPLRQGSYRVLAATANFFARESHMDEIAHSIHVDPLAFRLKNLKNKRLRNVFIVAAERFGWDTIKSQPGHGFGIAGGFVKRGNVATCVEVEVSQQSGKVRIVRVVQAFECGAIINPDHLENQVVGAIIQGLGGALFESIDFENGRIRNPHFSRYRVPRFSDVPPIEVVLLDRKDIPSGGAGETPIAGIAPAIGNAIFNATGVRLRALPMVPNGLTT